MSLYDDMKNIQKEMLNVLGDFKSTNNSSNNQMYYNSWHPKCDIIETKKYLIVLVALAGIYKEDIHIINEENFLRIYGERKLISSFKGISYHTMEIESGKFERKIVFPNIPIDKENPTVTFENGFLQISFKIIKTQKKVIDIE